MISNVNYVDKIMRNVSRSLNKKNLFFCIPVIWNLLWIYEISELFMDVNKSRCEPIEQNLSRSASCANKDMQTRLIMMSSISTMQNHRMNTNMSHFRISMVIWFLHTDFATTTEWSNKQRFKIYSNRTLDFY